MPIDHLASPRAKLARARTHLQELQVEIQKFYHSRPYQVRVREDRNAGKRIYYVSSVADTPHRLASIAGDVLQNARSALDHLAYRLVLTGTGTVGPFSHVYFPISEDATRYKADRSRKVQGMRQDAIDALDALQPYKGGNDVLWRLHALNNIDKHRTLMTVGSAFRSLDIGAHLHASMEQAFGPVPVPPIQMFLRPAIDFSG